MNRRYAFTLIELSIVLAIIGLLVGGVVAGKSLIRGQTLRNVLQDAKTYAIAKQLFSDKYGALPGDMPDAMRVWGNADGGAATAANCSNPTTTVSVGNLTCNGNGNGIIESSNSENFRAWQQLSAAGMISGTYTGIRGAGSTNHALPGENTPKASLDKTTFVFLSGGQQAGGTFYYEGNYNNMFLFGKAVTNSWPNGPALTPLEAYEMDKKVDDALPATGNVRTLVKTFYDTNTTPSNCVSSDTPASATYAIGESHLGCVLLFMSGFQAKPQ